MKKYFCLRKSFKYRIGNILLSQWQLTMNVVEVQLLSPKVSWLGNFPLAFFLFLNFIYLLSQGPGNTFTWLKNQKVQKETVQVYLTSPATCHLVSLPGGNWSVPVSCVLFQRCFMQIHAYPIYIYIYIYVLFLQWWELTPGLHTHILFKMAVFLNPQVVDIA